MDLIQFSVNVSKALDTQDASTCTAGSVVILSLTSLIVAYQWACLSVNVFAACEHACSCVFFMRLFHGGHWLVSSVVFMHLFKYVWFFLFDINNLYWNVSNYFYLFLRYSYSFLYSSSNVVSRSVHLSRYWLYQ